MKLSLIMLTIKSVILRGAAIEPAGLIFHFVTYTFHNKPGSSFIRQH